MFVADDGGRPTIEPDTPAPTTTTAHRTPPQTNSPRVQM
jgi:hypothetical protein